MDFPSWINRVCLEWIHTSCSENCERWRPCQFWHYSKWQLWTIRSSFSRYLPLDGGDGSRCSSLRMLKCFQLGNRYDKVRSWMSIGIGRRAFGIAMHMNLLPSPLPIIFFRHMGPALLPCRFVFGINKLKFFVISLSGIVWRHCCGGIVGLSPAMSSAFMSSCTLYTLDTTCSASETL